MPTLYRSAEEWEAIRIQGLEKRTESSNSRSTNTAKEDPLSRRTITLDPQQAGIGARTVRLIDLDSLRTSSTDKPRRLNPSPSLRMGERASCHRRAIDSSVAS